MPPDEVAKLLHDMRRAGQRIGRFVAAKKMEDYAADEMLRSAVERQFAIIGEAMMRLIKLDSTTAAQITEHRKIAGFRNVLVHGYDAIDDVTTWEIIQRKLPVLLNDLERLLEGGP